MNEAQLPDLDHDAFPRVWRRVMPEDRPDCPFTLEEPAPAPEAPVESGYPIPRESRYKIPSDSRYPASAPAICLGEDNAGALPDLDRFLALTAEALGAYRAMARRRRGSLPATLAQAKRQQLRRLAAARFLIAGTPYAVPAGEKPRTMPLALALRERYQAEQRAALELFAAANATADPCLIDLYRALGLENQTHAGQLREWLERM